jgi:hypothetical protein
VNVAIPHCRGRKFPITAIRLGSDGFDCTRARSTDIASNIRGREPITSNPDFGNIALDSAIRP